MQLNARSQALLKKLHPDLRRVVEGAAKVTKVDFIVTCTSRSLEEQQVLLKKGATRTLKSRHIPAPNGWAHAVDLAATIDGKVRWDWPLYGKLAEAMKAAAKVEKVPVEWGGDWRTFKDGPHFQLPWSSYPGTK